MSSGNSVTLRRGTSRDIAPILNLLAESNLPRSYFAPFYLNDTSYRPEQSWLVERRGRLVSHLRVFDRWIRVGQTKLHIAGIGNIITAKDARKHGYAGQLLLAALSALQQEKYAYSLLETSIPQFSARYGWVLIEQQTLRAVLPSSLLYSIKIAPFRNEDLPEVMRLYDVANAERTGTTIRSASYWQNQFTWLSGYRDGFLIARDSTEGPLLGYVRSRTRASDIDILELGLEDDRFDIGRALLTTVSKKRNGQLQGSLPPSQRVLFLPGEFELFDDPGLMGRAINLTELLHTLKPMWQKRLQEAGIREGSFSLSTSAGSATVQASNGTLQTRVHNTAAMTQTPSMLNESQFTHLLFHGVDEHAQSFIEHRPNAAFLHTLFPPQDFVMWQSDAFQQNN